MNLLHTSMLCLQLEHLGLYWAGRGHAVSCYVTVPMAVYPAFWELSCSWAGPEHSARLQGRLPNRATSDIVVEPDLPRRSQARVYSTLDGWSLQISSSLRCQ